MYDEGTKVNLLVVADEGYPFVNWSGDVGTVANVNAAATSIAMNGNYSIGGNFALETCDRNDLDDIRGNLGGSYIPMNDLDSTTADYEELASSSANEGKGWQPIGAYDELFAGSFDGRQYEIRDLFINRADESGVGLFGDVASDGGIIKNIGVVNVTVTGNASVGGLVGASTGTVSNSFQDIETSGRTTSAGGTGKTTVQVKSVATFSGARWNITAVANPGTRNPSYIWNIVDGQTYPFLSWQS